MKNGTVVGSANPVGASWWAVAVMVLVLGCQSQGAPPVARAEVPAGARASAPVAAPPAEPPGPAAVAAPVPRALADVAAQFHLAMLGDGWSWVAIDRNKTRFDWS